MKESVFNYYMEVNDKKYLFNTNNSGLLEITKQDFNEEEKKYLMQHGFFVNDEEDEIQQLEKEINHNIFCGSQTLELTIALTNQCNFRCAYCYQDKNQKVMSRETADDILNKIEETLKSRKYKKIYIHYFGGEPLLNIPILKYLDMNIQTLASKNGVEYHTYLTVSIFKRKLLCWIKF